MELQYSAKNNSSDWGGWGIDGNFSSTWLAPRDAQGDPLLDKVIGWSLSTVSWSLVNEFETGDPRLDATVYDAEANLTKYTRAYQNTGYFPKKYMGIGAYVNAIEQSHNWSKNFILIRYADVLLMAAELFLDDNPTKALGYLNEVRERALGPGSGLLAIDLDAIYHERRVELGSEGLRNGIY
ncbi:MAG: RagB/SusD family nutrient uptake outer membrane protein [Chloroflexia bacterium]|nr:RagB/SusD family nutrient uptake outer membrane protein [Chloroflexia bacterium]